MFCGKRFGRRCPILLTIEQPALKTEFIPNPSYDPTVGYFLGSIDQEKVQNFELPVSFCYWLLYLQVIGQHVGYKQTEEGTGKQAGLLILQHVGQ